MSGSFKRGAGGQRAAAVGFEDVRRCVERRLTENHVVSMVLADELRRLRIKADTH